MGNRPSKKENIIATSLAQDHNRYFNREISWLKFNERVIEEAENVQNPLLERVRFLSISASNLDEFFSVRVAGLIALLQDDIHKIAMTGENPAQQLSIIYEDTQRLMQRQQNCMKHLLEALSKEGICLISRDEITSDQEIYLESLFFDQLFPVLTPIAIDPVHPFPFIPHQGLSLIIALQSPHCEQDHLNIIIPIPATLDRFYRFPSNTPLKDNFIAVENIILANLKRLFPNYNEVGSGVFSILRDTDLEIEEEAEDLVREFESALRKRKRGDIIRMKITASTPPNLIDIIDKKLNVNKASVIFVDGIVGLSFFSQIIIKERTDLLFPRYVPKVPEKLKDQENNIFQLLKNNDLLLHHPFESFDTVVDFIRQAANDEKVVAIKSTLYRTSAKSPIIDALIEAAENGKAVTAIVELKARFDEAANILQAKALERAGVHVVYGLAGCKIHAKTLLVVRQEDKKLKIYTHFGTGNYHPVTAKIYTDLSLFTADDILGRDACRLFNYISGYIKPSTMAQLSVAPLTLKDTLLTHIQQEIDNAKKGLPAEIYAKMNALVDSDMINALYKASSFGVKIMLNIRGICCLKPGIKGLSENITVISIVGRFLEHSRIICFANGHEFLSMHNKLYISSADWMPRNLERRVELLIPINQESIKMRIIHNIMAAFFKDNTQSWQLLPDGTYKRIDSKKKNYFNVHDYFMSLK